MNSLELIKSEIYDAKTNLEKFTKLQKNEPKNTNYSFYKTYFTNRLTILQQIKSELEAWEVCKKHMELYQSQQYILAKETTNKTSETIQARVFINDQKQVQTIIKALEVEDE